MSENRNEEMFRRIQDVPMQTCWLCKGQNGWEVWRQPRGDDDPTSYGSHWVDCPVCEGTGVTDTLSADAPRTE